MPPGRGCDALDLCQSGRPEGPGPGWKRPGGRNRESLAVDGWCPCQPGTSYRKRGTGRSVIPETSVAPLLQVDSETSARPVTFSPARKSAPEDGDSAEGDSGKGHAGW